MRIRTCLGLGLGVYLHKKVDGWSRRLLLRYATAGVLMSASEKVRTPDDDPQRSKVLTDGIHTQRALRKVRYRFMHSLALRKYGREVGYTLILTWQRGEPSVYACVRVRMVSTVFGFWCPSVERARSLDIVKQRT